MTALFEEHDTFVMCSAMLNSGAQPESLFSNLVAIEAPDDVINALLQLADDLSSDSMTHIKEALEFADGPEDFIVLLTEAAEEMTSSDKKMVRDRGRHILMTFAKKHADWQVLSTRFLTTDWPDMRQKVIERFLVNCSSADIALSFTKELIKLCLAELSTTKKRTMRETSLMWWIFNSADLIGLTEGLDTAATIMRKQFGYNLPKQLQNRIRKLSKGTSPADLALAEGYEIHSTSGRQVILKKEIDGVMSHITRYYDKEGSKKKGKGKR